MRLRIACAQINPAVGDLAGNTELAVARIAEAAAQGADVVCLPELALTGYPPEDLLLKPGFIAAARAALDEVATAAEDVVAVVGTVHRDTELYNAAAICAGGEVRGWYHKRHLPNYGVFDERRYFASGEDAGPLLRIRGVTVGVTICEDVWMPDGPLLDQARAGIELALNVNGSPYHRGKQAFRRAMLATRASDSAVPLAFVNMVGGQDELVFDGGSMLFDAEGGLVAAAPQFSEGLWVWDVDCSEAFRRRLRDTRPRSWDPVDLPVLELASRSGPGAEGPPLAPPTVAPLMGEAEEVYRALVQGVRDYLGKNGFRSAVLGLSGGVDSSLTAAVAVDALGRDAVTGLAMPSPFSSLGSLADAEALARNLGVAYEVVAVSDVLQTFLHTLKPVFDGVDPGLAEENLQARIRGNILMAFSNARGAILLSTGNKSEMATGYCTLYGDMAGGFAVLKDVPKTLVYDLCRWRNSLGGEIVPESVLTKPPSAELRPDQLDTDSLPPYEVLDPVLEAYVEEDLTGAEIVAAGIADAELVERVVHLVDASEYKRRQAPPGVRITPKAFGRDRRLPITNRYRG